ncbi:MAG: tRNA (adenosine(37)-N6)-threonylcarbamoyltransferase complex ATPase subunit type 1 TsaE [Caldilinea sp. CFX5]|nr:tRNA (adenosine(37)-N6)-threonylcarbamoyltransferase complex ATPase subunit type 1 TsaE [Caldilinea sp. CFX5]
MLTFTTTTYSAAETFQLGQQLGQSVQAGQVIALHGDLGAGKTVLTQGLANGLGITARVTSPTFTLVGEYPRPSGEWLIHIDCYRLGSPTQEDGSLEAAFFGMEEILDRADAIVVIEWAEQVAALLPPDYLQITLHDDQTAPEQRQLRFIAHGSRSKGVIKQLQAIRTITEHTDEAAA